MTASKRVIKIALVGKYVQHGASNHNDVYVSVLEALKHAAGSALVKIEIEAIDSNNLDIEKLRKAKYDGMVVPQGWGSRGVEGIITAVEFARVNKIPYLGLCFGMQMATIEFARNVCGLHGANSTEVDPKTKYPVVMVMADQVEYLKKKQYGGTIRLGAWPCQLKKGTLLASAYAEFGKDTVADGVVMERHRHRYEVNQEYLKLFENKGMIISGSSPDGKLVEAIELDTKLHPFMVATQYHPEYKSRFLQPHPLFVAFIEHCL